VADVVVVDRARMRVVALLLIVEAVMLTST